MSNITRRALLEGASAAALTGALATPSLAGTTQGDDARILELYSNIKELSRHCKAPGLGLSDDELDLILDDQLDLLCELLATPANTLAGIRAKLRLVADLDGVRIDTLTPADAYDLAGNDPFTLGIFSVWADLEA